MGPTERILVIGAGGRLGAALCRQYSPDLLVTGLNRTELDLTQLEQVRAAIWQLEFDLLINCAALTNVDYCESHAEEALRVNAEAPQLMAEICQAKNRQLVHISTDYVFDGEKREPYTEEDNARPISIYGQSKLRGEQRVLEANDQALVIRVSWVFGPDRASFVDKMIQRARENADIAAVADKFSTPSYTIDIARWLEHAWESGATGLLHLANGGACSWQEYAQYAIECCQQEGVQVKGRRVAAQALEEMKNFVARRPVHTVLSTEKFARLSGVTPRNWREAVAEYVRDYVARK